MGKSYFIRTEEGTELVHGVFSMNPFGYEDGHVVEWQVMFEDSKPNEGTFCWDYVEVGGDLKSFLMRNLDR